MCETTSSSFGGDPFCSLFFNGDGGGGLCIQISCYCPLSSPGNTALCLLLISDGVIIGNIEPSPVDPTVFDDPAVI